MKKIALILLVCIGTFTAFGQKRITSKSPKEKLNEEYCSGLFRMEDGTIVDVASDNSVSGYLNILDWMQGRVAGLQVYTSRRGIKIPVIRNQIASIYLDELPISADVLNSIPVTDIAMVKVIKGPSAGIFGSSGVIAVYTLEGDDHEANGGE